MRIQVSLSSALHEDAVSQKLVALIHAALEKSTEAEPVAERPDLIHVLGLGDRTTMNAIHRAHQQRIPLVISPLGGFQPWQHCKPSLRVLTQASRYHNTISIHACSQIEQDNLLAVLSSPEISQSLVTIANPIVTTIISEADFCQQMLALYAATALRHDKAIRQEIDTKVAALNEADGTICQILRQAIYANYQHQQGHIANSTLDLLATTLTNSNYDESLFAERLSQIGLTVFFSQIETIMQEHNNLTEGFMPIDAKPYAKNLTVI